MTSGPLRRLLGLARRASDPTDDAGLLARFAASADADAFELLVWRHGGMVLGVARRILGDEHAAEDAFQATFLALARQAKSVRRNGCVAGWLHRVARRVAMRAKQKGERRGVSATCLEGSEHVGLTARRSPGDDPLAAAQRRELSQVLDEELDRLPERFRRAVVLCYLEGRSTAEAAERLGCPRGTVLSRLATAREKLKVRLLRRGIAPAILPAIDLSPVIHGGLTSATVRAVVANTAAPSVIDLCDGVLRAMILSKLKLATAVVLTAGMIGGGAGWMALAPGGPGLAVAAGQGKTDLPKPDRAKEEERRAAELAENQQLQISKLRAELAEAQDQMRNQEDTWARERIDARLRFAQAEDRYQQLAKVLAQSMTPDTLNMEWSFENEVNSLRTSIGDAMKKPGKAEKDPKIAEMRSSLAVAESNLKTTREPYGRLQAAVQQARGAMVTAEEQLFLFDRITALKRRSAQSQVEDLQDRLNQLRGGSGRPDSVEQKVQTLEHKLDDVLRELTELRRELRK